MSFTDDQVDSIRMLRGFAIPWQTIAERIGASVAECREAIGMPVVEPHTEPQSVPWQTCAQPDLFSGQPVRDAISER